MSNYNKLKPCPFCGGEAVNENTPYCDWIECSLCRCQSESFVNRDEAIAAWNRRASPWISVDERLPTSQSLRDECNDYVLVSTPAYKPFKAMFCDGEWCKDYTAKLVVEVTHWMPLPELPEVPDDD